MPGYIHYMHVMNNVFIISNRHNNFVKIEPEFDEFALHVALHMAVHYPELKEKAQVSHLNIPLIVMDKTFNYSSVGSAHLDNDNYSKCFITVSAKAIKNQLTGHFEELCGAPAGSEKYLDLMTVAHELWHIYQYNTGRLKTRPDSIIFDGNNWKPSQYFCITLKEYTQLPWEKEANNHAISIAVNLMKSEEKVFFGNNKLVNWSNLV